MTVNIYLSFSPLRVESWILIACLIAPVAHAEVYKWTDENGHIHYGDRPENTDSKPLK